jgi:NAD(P)-dependent dehydrogenase (short-subunit alcohol dehydrogenase family)
MDGVRWAYAASVFSTRIMIEQNSGFIVNISVPTPNFGNPAYNAAKTAVDRLTREFAHLLKDHHIAAVSLYPGLVRTEGIIKQAQWFDMSNSESPQFTGRAILALATDPTLMEYSGQMLVVAKLAQVYDFDDVDGKRPHPSPDAEAVQN